MTTYKLIDEWNVLRVVDNASIPQYGGNRDYQEYLDWLDAGNTPEPAPLPPSPVELTPSEKLVASGLTVEELKTLLGLK